MVHPVEVAKILAELGMDRKTALVAGLLHDTVEDTDYSQALIKDFGEEVALLVDGVTKLKSLVYESKNGKLKI